MNQREKSAVLWVVWIVCVLVLLWFVFHSAAYGAPRKPKYPTQGSGALALIAPPSPTGPRLTVRAINLPVQVYYFAATAEGGGLSSDFSAELAYTRPDSNVKYITLAWDGVPGTNPVVTNYVIWKGRVSGSYTNSYSAGTNLTLTVPLLPLAPTNLVITVTSRNATNLQYSPSLGKPWTLLGATNYTATNPPMRVWRGLGRSKTSPPVLAITSRWQ